MEYETKPIENTSPRALGLDFIFPILILNFDFPFYSYRNIRRQHALSHHKPDPSIFKFHQQYQHVVYPNCV